MRTFRLLLPLAATLAVVPPTAASAAWRAEDVPGTTGALSVRSLGVDPQGRALTVFEGFLQERSPQRFTGTATRAPAGGWTRGPDVAGMGWGSAQALLYGQTRVLLVARQVSGTGAFNRSRFRLVA